ncbi:MAG: secretin N-terminal domain-containing protein, partial [Nitrospinota bacterium]
MAGGEARAGRREGRPSLRACGAVAWALAALLALAAGLDRASGQAPERVAPLGPGDLVALDFDNADIRVVIKHISELTGRNFLVDEKVRGRVTIITPRKIRVRDVYQVFQSLLHIYGFTTIPAGKVTKIVPLREAARSGVPTIPARDPAEVSRTDRVVTGIIRVVHAEASALASILRPMVAREGSLLPYGPANALILTDTAANVRRLTSIIRAVDVAPAAARVAVVRLKYASAKELAGTLGQLVETAVREPTPPPARRRAARPPRGARAPTPARPAVKILPDERVNALILVAPAAEMVRVRRLVKSLDVPAPPERARIHVYRLENAVAEDLARVLTQQIGEPAPAEPGAKPAA